jgi:hypothetical protein
MMPLDPTAVDVADLIVQPDERAPVGPFTEEL